MSLSSWFRDYIYIPLGGSKVGNVRRYINIFIVWMITGLWHGASWNFILWGIYFAILLIIEKAFLLNFLNKHKIIGHFYTLFFVLISFVIFNITDINNIILFLKKMFGLSNLEIYSIETWYYLKNYIGVIIIAIISSIPWLRIIKEKINNNDRFGKMMNLFEPIIYIILLIIVTSYIVDESFNPFLYFRF